MREKDLPGAARPRAARAALVGVGFSIDGKPVIEAAELFSGAKTVTIRSEGEEYLLEKTRNGKLMLKK